MGRPLPGAVDLLRACKAQGLTVVLASSAGEAESGGLLAALDAEDAIDGATFSGDAERTKPAPDLVRVALEKAADRERPRAPGAGVWRTGSG